MTEADEAPSVFGGVMLRAERGGIVASNPALGRQASLGPEAASSVPWFDGSRSVAEIAALSARRYGGSLEAARDRALGAMASLAGIGALSTVPLDAPRPPRIARAPRMADTGASSPRAVIWEVTGACNLRCAHCLADSGGRDRGELDASGALALVERFAEAGVLSVTLAGGEPLIRPDILSIIDALSAAGIGVDLATNGYSAGDGLMRELARRPVFSVQVSVDGIGAEHDALRGREGSFDAAVGALRRFKAAGFRTSVSSVATKPTLGSLGALADLAASLGCSAFKALPFLPAGRGASRKAELCLDPQGHAAFARTVVAKRDQYRGRMGVFMESAMPFLLEGSRGDGEAFRAPPDAQAGCAAGRDSLYVGCDGTAYPCPFFKDFPLGNALESSLYDIWLDSPFLGELRGLTAADLPGECAGCGHLGLRCYGGCRAAAWLDSGDLRGTDPTCYKRALEGTGARGGDGGREPPSASDPATAVSAIPNS